MPLGDDFVTVATIDHLQAVIDRLPQQWKNSPNLIALMLIFAQRYQDLENAFQVLLAANIFHASGARLDQYGKLVGQPRQGLADPDYQRYILARVATNRSDGTIEDFITIASLVLNDISAQIVVDNQGAAGVVVRILNVTVADALANILSDFLQDAVAAGVHMILETQYTADSDTWMFAIATFANGAISSSATSIVVDSTAGFPSSGTLHVDEGLAGYDVVTYNGITATSFLNTSGVAHSHVDRTEVSLASGPGIGLGMGDTSNPATGGELESARDAHYP